MSCSTLEMRETLEIREKMKVTDHTQKGTNTHTHTHTHTTHTTHTHTRSRTVEPRTRLPSILCTHFTAHTLLQHTLYYKHFTTHTHPDKLYRSILQTLYYTQFHTLLHTHTYIRCHEQWNPLEPIQYCRRYIQSLYYCLLLLCFTAALLLRYYTPHTRSRTVEPRTLLPSILSMTSFSFTPPAAADPPIPHTGLVRFNEV